jgi:hypothetical protein
MALGIEGETVSEESNNGESESDSESATSGTNVDWWKGVTLGDKKSKAYIVRLQGHNLTFCRMENSWIILVLF